MSTGQFKTSLRESSNIKLIWQHISGNIYIIINDLPDCLEKSTPCLYADDSFSSAKDCVELNANLNHDLNNVSQWLVN
jgi:hypothetical protein